METEVGLTSNGLGHVGERSSAAIARTVDRGIIAAGSRRSGGTRLRRLGGAEPPYLVIASLVVGTDLTPTARRKRHEAVRRLPIDARRVNLGAIRFDPTDVDRRIARRFRRMKRVKALVTDDGSWPGLRGTDVPVHAVAAPARRDDDPSARRERAARIASRG